MKLNYVVHREYCDMYMEKYDKNLLLDRIWTNFVDSTEKDTAEKA